METLKNVCNWDRACSCDDRCDVYGDCCTNADKYDPANTKFRSFDCIKTKCGSVYVKNLCDETSWTDNRTRQLCLEPETASDLLGNDEDRLFAYLPVISLRTNVTYNNIYCARCNNDDQRTIFWSFQFTNSCRLHRPSSDASNDDDEHSNLLKQTSARGYSDDEYEYDEEETIRFSGLYINVPDDFALTTRKCVPGMKSSCPVATSDDVLRKNCSSYTEIVRDSSNGNVIPKRTLRSL